MGARFAFSVVAALLVWTDATGQQARPSNCSGEPYRAFDFWVGTWDVFDPSGKLVGTNTIERDLNGCVLHESWQSVSGGHRGSSFNIYDRNTGRWHQTWVDNTGLLLLIDGGLVDGKMVLEGRTTDANGGETTQRITWSVVEDGRVRQLWEQKGAGSAEWTVAFDGAYVRR